MSATIQQIANVSGALGEKSLNNTIANTTYYSMANYDRALFVVTVGNDGATSNLRLQILQSTNTSVLGSAAVTAVTNVAMNSSANAIGKIEVRVDDMNVAGGYGNIGLQITELASAACNVSAIIIRTPSRYPQATLPA